MNPRQRRGVLLMVMAAIGAVVVFMAIVAYIAQVEASVGRKTTVLQVQTNLEAFQPIDPQDLEPVEIPARWTPDTYIKDEGELQNRVAAAPIPQGAYLQQGMLREPPSLQEGQREIAIMVDAEAGVAGQVQIGDTVDIYATFAATQEGDRPRPPCARRVLDRVEVLKMGDLVPKEGAGQAEEGASEPASVVPVTFALNPDDTLKLTYIQSFAQQVRMAKVGGKADPKPPTNRLCTQPEAGN